MNKLTNSLFSTEYGKELYEDFLRAVRDFDLDKYLGGGVVIGLSGGADSVALLLLLLEYKKKRDFYLKAVHINHMIRGAEAERDEAFARDLCTSLGVDFVSYSIDIPMLARKENLGIEEAARNARYSKFKEIIASDPALSTIAVAHNATDNLETVLFNMMRGSGLTGICGIRPVRDNIVRPLIYSSKELIRKALFASDIQFVVDSTNLSSDYSRNYIRNEIIPKLNKLNDSPERMCTRMTSNLRDDDDFLLESAKDFILQNEIGGKLPKEALASLKKPIFSRVISLLCKKLNLPSPEKIHIDSAFSLIKNEKFALSLPGGVSLISSGGSVFISESIEEQKDFSFEIKEGINKFDGFDSIIVLSKEKECDCFSNVYKKSIQAKIWFDIINDRLFIRSKQDGDSYRFGKMNRKLKKLFNDKKISPSDRKLIPIFCDKNGILWVPGFPVRDGTTNGEEFYITIFDPISNENGNKYFYIGNN